tara:strand:- start:137 stop:427 length:291 start_codon:yes stop_codon:yes gene_type:complete
MPKYARLTPEALTQALAGDNLVSFWFRKGHGSKAPVVSSGAPVNSTGGMHWRKVRLLQGYVSAVRGTQCRIRSDTGRGAWWVATDALLFHIDPLND